MFLHNHATQQTKHQTTPTPPTPQKKEKKRKRQEKKGSYPICYHGSRSPELLCIAKPFKRCRVHKLVMALKSPPICCITWDFQSHTEAVSYENCLLSDSLNPDSTPTEGFLQFVFDNADFNTNILNTMGGVKCGTPATNIERSTPVPRIKETVYAGVWGTPGHTKSRTHVDISARGLYLSPEDASWSMMRAMKVDFLWMVGCSMEIVPKPSRAGFMR